MHPEVLGFLKTLVSLSFLWWFSIKKKNVWSVLLYGYFKGQPDPTVHPLHICGLRGAWLVTGSPSLLALTALSPEPVYPLPSWKGHWGQSIWCQSPHIHLQVLWGKGHDAFVHRKHSSGCRLQGLLFTLNSSISWKGLCFEISAGKHSVFLCMYQSFAQKL